jgi:hypothetical protein
MTYDRRQPISQSFFVLQTVALAVGLASIDKAFDEVDQYFGRAANEARKTVEEANNAAREKVTAGSPAVDNTALSARATAALNAAPRPEASIIGLATGDGPVTHASPAENGTTRDLAEQPPIER